MAARTVIVETMHGCDQFIPEIARPGICCISTAQPIIAASAEHPGSVLGLIKGPRSILRQQDVQLLIQYHPELILSYIGRHPHKILSPDIRISLDTHYHILLYLQAYNRRLPLLFLACSPLSSSVAAFVALSFYNLLYGHIDLVKSMTITAGNTFGIRRGHLFTRSMFDRIKTSGDLHVVVMGTGEIGTLVIQAFARAGAQVSYTARSNKFFPSSRIHYYPSIPSLLRAIPQIDLLTLHLPPEIIVPLELVQQARVLVNTASGSTLSPDKLLTALEERRIGIALIDVFDQEGPAFNGNTSMLAGQLRQSRLNPEPHPLDTEADTRRKTRLRRLIDEHRLFLTPHIAYNEPQALKNTLMLALEHLLWYASLRKASEQT